MLDVYYDQLRSVFVVTSSPVTMSVLVFLVTPKITQLIAFTALLSRTIVYGILWPWSPPPPQHPMRSEQPHFIGGKQVNFDVQWVLF